MVLEGVAEALLPYADVIYALWIIALTFLVGKTAFFIFQHGILDSKKNKLHAHVVSEMRIPFYLLITSISVYYAGKTVKFLEPYYELMDDVFVVFGVLLGVYVIQRSIKALVVWYSSKDRKPVRIEKTALISLRRLISIFVYGIALVLILSQLGVEVSPLLASLGIGGLAIALALQPTLSNYFAGIYIASDKTIRIGDYIELSPDQRGTVEKMTWRTIWIRTLTNNVIVVPNSKLADSTIINYSQPEQSMMLWVPVGVAYNTDLEKAEKVALGVAKKILKRTETGVDGEEPFVRFDKFGDSNIDFKMLFKIKEYAKQFELKDEYIKALKKAFDKEGIEISFPCTNVYMRK